MSKAAAARRGAGSAGGAAIRAIICDDHPIVREGMRLVVNASGDILLQDEAATGHELLEKIRTGRYDVVILDISLQGYPDGLEILKTIKSEHLPPAVLVLSMHSEEQSAVRMLRAGAAGYIVKGSKPDDILAAIRKVAAGGRYISPSLAELLATDLENDRVKPAHETLSDQEFKVLRLLSMGTSLSGTARQLGVSPSTVGTYRSRIMSKLGIANNAEMVRYAIENGLVE